MRETVEVRSTWEASHTFEFDTTEEAEAFAERVNQGNMDGLNAIVEAGDIDSVFAELVDWSAH